MRRQLDDHILNFWSKLASEWSPSLSGGFLFFFFSFFFFFLFPLQLNTACQSACSDSETCSMLGNFPRMQPKMSLQGAKQQEEMKGGIKTGCALYPHLHPSPFYARNFLSPPSPSRVISTFLSFLHIKH